MEYAASEREQLLMLNQQIQLQSKNMTSASELYSAQRKKVHDFRAHLNILNRLMKNQEYSAAEEYLEKITEQQTDRLFLVNTHHPILDALFNTKAAEATQKKISIDFEVNDLSKLPFDASDMVVLLSTSWIMPLKHVSSMIRAIKRFMLWQLFSKTFLSLSETHRNLL